MLSGVVMASLVDAMGPAGETRELMQLMHNPMFNELQAELSKECTQVSIPYTLMSDTRGGADQTSMDDVDLVVEDATLQVRYSV